MILVSYDGFVFPDLDMAGGLGIDRYRGQWQTNARYVPRVGAAGFLTPGDVSPTVIEADIIYDGTDDEDLLLTFDRMVGRLDPLNQSPTRKLVMDRPDGVRVWRYATVVVAGMPDPDGSINSLRVRFTSADPLWRKEEAVSIFPSTPLAQVTGTHSAVSLPNSGQAPIHPLYRLDWNGTEREDADKTSSLGWSKRWTLTLTNNRPNTVPPFPYWIELGETDGLVLSGEMRADGDDVRVLYQGQEVPRDLIAFDSPYSLALVLLPRMESGQEIELDIVYGNSEAGSPRTLAYPHIPACHADWYVGASLVSSTDALVNITESDEVKAAIALGGSIVGLTGANLGVYRTIQGFTSGGGVTTVFHDTMPASWGTASGFLILPSKNGRLNYATQIIERDSPYRGRWYLSSGESPPDRVDYRVPVSWKPELYQDGRDKKGQKRYSRLSTGGDLDSFAILDTARTWENGPTIEEEGGADGVSLSLPFPITAYRWQGQIINPSGMCRAVVASRGQGGEQWRIQEEATEANEADDVWDPGTINLASDTLHLYTGLIPVEGEEIPPDWRSDQGTTTATGTTTSLTDGEKDWRVDQWVGATVRFTSGKNKGKSKIVTANTATTVSWSGAIVAVAGDNTYELKHPPLRATLNDYLECNVDVDLSDLDVTGDWSEAVDVYHLRGRLWIGGGYGASPARRGRITIGSTTDFVLIRSSEELRFDSGRRSAYIWHVPSETVIRRFAEPTIQWESIVTADDGTGVLVTTERRSLDGMPLPIGENPLANPGAEDDASGVDVEVSGGVVASDPPTRVTSPTPYQQPGAFRLQITTNPGSGYAQMVWPPVPIRPGELVEMVAALRATHAHLRPLLAARWLDVDLAPIQTSVQAAYTPDVDTWMSIGEQFTAHEDAAFFEPIVRMSPGGTSLGSIYVDALDPGSPVLWYDEVGSAGLKVGATYQEGYFG